MTIDKAIKILSHFGRYRGDVEFKDIKEAIKLGLEALKSHQLALKGFTNPEKYFLPGETKE